MDKNWDGKTKGSLLGHKIFVIILKTFGLNSAYFLLRFVALWFSIFSVKGAKAQYYFFRKRLKFNFLKSIFSVYKNHFIFGQILLDRVAIFSGLAHKFKYTHNNAEIIKNMIINNTGGILINAHVGSWQSAGKLLEMYGDKIYLVMVDAEHQKIKSYLNSVTDKNAIEIIPIEKNGAHLVKIDEVLKNKGIIAFHGDRFIDSSGAAEVDFFGEKAKFAKGPFQLAAKYGVPYTFATAFKENRKQYSFYAIEPRYINYPGSLPLRREEIKIHMKLYVSELETMLKKYPEQWFNYYHFWETNN